MLNVQNNGLVNSFNPVQLSACICEHEHKHFCVSHHNVIEYCAKYATKCEPRSQPMKNIITKIVRSLKDDNTSLKAVQKLLMQEKATTQKKKPATCSSSYQCSKHPCMDFIVLSLDGSRAVEEQLDEGQPATALSILDHYIAHPATPQFQNMKLSSLCSTIHHT